MNVWKKSATMRTVLLQNKGLVELLQSVTTIAAIIVGGYWTYHLFIAHRGPHPHINIQHKATSKIISPGVTWLHLTVSFENTGDSLASLHGADIWVQKVLPLEPSIRTELSAGKDVVSKKDNVVPWPLVCRYKIDLAVEIEPKEIANRDFDFLIPSTLKTIRIYTYVENASEDSRGWLYRRAQHIGWRLGSIHDIGEETDNDKSKAPEIAHLTAFPVCRIDKR